MRCAKNDTLPPDDLPEGVIGHRPVHDIHLPGQIGFGELAAERRSRIQRQRRLDDDGQIQVRIGLGTPLGPGSERPDFMTGHVALQDVMDDIPLPGRDVDIRCVLRTLGASLMVHPASADADSPFTPTRSSPAACCSRRR